MRKLRITWFAALFAGLAVPACAETLDLACDNEQRASLELRVDLDRKTVEVSPGRSCTWNIEGRKIVVPNCAPPAPARITESDISWTGIEKIVNGAGGVGEREISGSVNRLTGHAWLRAGGFDGFRGTCRRAEKKF